jgi:hypothetical protein
MHKYLIIFALCGLCSASVLLTNGDFEMDLTIGWQQVEGGSYSVINRATTYHPDADYEAYAKDQYGSYAKLWQVVNIPTTDLEFSVYSKFYAYDNNEDTLCWAGAAIVISYLDSYGQLLGDTKICRFTAPCPWTNTSTSHVILAPDTSWHLYSFNIDSELANLPGINSADISKIEVALYAKTEHTC